MKELYSQSNRSYSLFLTDEVTVLTVFLRDEVTVLTVLLTDEGTVLTK